MRMVRPPRRFRSVLSPLSPAAKKYSAIPASANAFPGTLHETSPQFAAPNELVAHGRFAESTPDAPRAVERPRVVS